MFFAFDPGQRSMDKRLVLEEVQMSPSTIFMVMLWIKCSTVINRTWELTSLWVGELNMEFHSVGIILTRDEFHF